MSMFLVSTLLFISSTLYGTEIGDAYDLIRWHNMLFYPERYPYPTKLVPGMWGTEGYELPDHDGPQTLTPLTPEMVTTPFFMELANAPQERKNLVLRVATCDPIESKNYLKRRRNMLAALAAGAQVPPAGSHVELVQQATYFQDHYSLEWLLGTYHCDVHEKNENSTRGDPPIMMARTLATADVLIRHGALQNGMHLKNLPFMVVNEHYDANLIPLYESQGISFWIYNEYNRRPLDYLVPQRDIVYKTLLLFKNLSAKEALTALSERITDNPPQTIFERTDERLANPRLDPKSVRQLHLFKIYLHTLQSIAINEQPKKKP